MPKRKRPDFTSIVIKATINSTGRKATAKAIRDVRANLPDRVVKDLEKTAALLKNLAALIRG